eukprot:601617-Prorocentrum_minimum.AAC.2
MWDSAYVRRVHPFSCGNTPWYAKHFNLLPEASSSSSSSSSSSLPRSNAGKTVLAASGEFTGGGGEFTGCIGEFTGCVGEFTGWGVEFTGCGGESTGCGGEFADPTVASARELLIAFELFVLFVLFVTRSSRGKRCSKTTMPGSSSYSKKAVTIKVSASAAAAAYAKEVSRYGPKCCVQSGGQSGEGRGHMPTARSHHARGE